MRIAAIVAVGLFAAAFLGCAYENGAPVRQVGEITEAVVHPDGSVEINKFPILDGEQATSEVCANGDYVYGPDDAAVRAAECYNRGQTDAFELVFRYSGGTVWTQYCLVDDFERALYRVRRGFACPRSAYIIDGEARIVTHGSAFPTCYNTDTGEWATCEGTPTPTPTPMRLDAARASPPATPTSRMCIIEMATFRESESRLLYFEWVPKTRLCDSHEPAGSVTRQHVPEEVRELAGAAPTPTQRWISMFEPTPVVEAPTHTPAPRMCTTERATLRGSEGELYFEWVSKVRLCDSHEPTGSVKRQDVPEEVRELFGERPRTTGSDN